MVLFNDIIDDINTGLKASLSWLDKAFGQSQTVIKPVNGVNYKVPCVYVGSTRKNFADDYIEVSPDAKIGNFSFITLHEPNEVGWNDNVQGYVTTPFSITFWFDLRKIFGTSDNRNIDGLKAEILRELNGGFMIRNGKLRINRIYETAQGVYKGYTLDETRNQYMMHPYGALRFEGELKVLEPCYNPT